MIDDRIPSYLASGSHVVLSRLFMLIALYLRPAREAIQQGEDIHLTVGGVPLGSTRSAEQPGSTQLQTHRHTPRWSTTPGKDSVSVPTSGNFSVTAMGNRTAPVNVGYRQVGGGGGTGGGYFTGDVNEVRIYNRALSADEVQAIYAYGQ